MGLSEDDAAEPPGISRATASRSWTCARAWLGNALAPDPSGEGFPSWLGATWQRSATLRYGENPHQRAALYVSSDGAKGLAHAKQLHGK